MENLEQPLTPTVRWSARVRDKVPSSCGSARGAQLNRSRLAVAQFMRVSTSLLTLLLAGCATNPQPICAQLVSKDWTYMGRDASLDEQLSSELPRAPYYTNEGRRVRVLRRVWYRQGDSRILACTFGGLSSDSCSVSSTEFERHAGTWSKGSENAMLCNVTL